MGTQLSTSATSSAPSKPKDTATRPLEAERLTQARTHRPYLHAGGRVRALDWDNVGTIIAICDRTGTAYVHFVAADGRERTNCMHWADIKPIDQPEPGELTADAVDYFNLVADAIDQETKIWHRLLADHDIAPTEPVIVPAAIEQRQRQLAHRLAGDTPDWLTWWLGQRPTDIAGATVWDDEVAALAAWRDARHLPDTVAGYGPRPDHPPRRSLATAPRTQPQHPHLASRPPTPARPATRHHPDPRRKSSNGSPNSTHILATAPPDQTRILDDLRDGVLTPADIHAAIGAALDTQSDRRDWILEHWPHVVEHAQLTAIRDRNGALAHWPTPLTADEQQLYDRLRAISTDADEPRTLTELDAELAQTDPAHHLRRLTHSSPRSTPRSGNSSTNEPACATSPTGSPSSTPTSASLHQQRQPIAVQHADAKIQAQLRRWGARRPQHLLDAITRRSTHLAHHALTNDDEWVIRRRANGPPAATDTTTPRPATGSSSRSPPTENAPTSPDQTRSEHHPADDALAPTWQRLNIRLAAEATSVGPSLIGQ